MRWSQLSKKWEKSIQGEERIIYVPGASHPQTHRKHVPLWVPLGLSWRENKEFAKWPLNMILAPLFKTSDHNLLLHTLTSWREQSNTVWRPEHPQNPGSGPSLPLPGCGPVNCASIPVTSLGFYKLQALDIKSLSSLMQLVINWQLHACTSP